MDDQIIIDNAKSAEDAAKKAHAKWMELNDEADKFGALQKKITASLEKQTEIHGRIQQYTKDTWSVSKILNADAVKSLNKQLEKEIQIEQVLKKHLEYKKDAVSATTSLVDSTFGKFKSILSRIPGGDIIYKHMFGGLQQKFETHVERNISRSLWRLSKGASIGSVLLQAMKSIASVATKIVVPLLSWYVLYKLITSAVKQFVEMDKAAEAFRRETGFTIKQTSILRGDAERLVRSYARFGVTMESVNKAASVLANTFGDNITFVRKNLEFVALMASNLGVAEEDSAKVLQNFMGMGNMSSDTAKNVILYTKELSQAGGVSFSKIMKDVAGASGNTLKFMRGNVLALVKASIEARRLGVDVKSIASAAESLTDFEGTFNKEMELSVLLGRNVNLMEMRRKAFAGDFVGLMKEQTDFLKEQGGLTNKNVFQVKAMAEAMGLSVDELVKMNSQMKMRNELQSLADSGNTEAMEELKNQKRYEDLSKANAKEAEKFSVSRMRSLREQSELQGRVNSMTNELKQMMLQIGGILYPVVKVLSSVLLPVLKFIGGFVDGFAKALGVSSDGAEGLSQSIEKILPVVTKVGASIGVGVGWLVRIQMSIASIFAGLWLLIKPISLIFSWSSSISGVFTKILSVLGSAAKFGAFFGKWVPIVGWVIMGIQALISLWGRFSKIFSDDTMSLGDKILAGLWAVTGGLVYDVLIKPFEDAWTWISSLWGGNSPSKVGLSILNGIESVGKALFDAITSPFKRAWDFVSSLFSKLPNSVKSVFGAGDLVKSATPVGVENTISAGTPVTGDNTTATRTPASEQNVVATNNVDAQQAVVKKLDELISLMKAGGIAINLDGKRVSEQLAYAVA